VSKAVKIIDDGWTTFTVENDKSEASVSVDVYEANNGLTDLANRFAESDRGDDSTTYESALRTFVMSLGFPSLSHRANGRIRDAIYARCAELVGQETDAGKGLAGSPLPA
jgi:hypothetical protein